MKNLHSYNFLKTEFARQNSTEFRTKNNIQRGIAEMSIVGKGNYAGKKIVTFNIE
jgi:hypothetical protein